MEPPITKSKSYILLLEIKGKHLKNLVVVCSDKEDEPLTRLPENVMGLKVSLA